MPAIRFMVGAIAGGCSLPVAVSANEFREFGAAAAPAARAVAYLPRARFSGSYAGCMLRYLGLRKTISSCGTSGRYMPTLRLHR